MAGCKRSPDGGGHTLMLAVSLDDLAHLFRLLGALQAGTPFLQAPPTARL